MAAYGLMTKTGNQTWLARQLGISQPRVSQLVRGGKIPRKDQYNAADVRSAKRMMIEARQAANATMTDADDSDLADNPNPEEILRRLRLNPEKAARVKLLVARTAKLDLETKLAAGNLIERDEMKRLNTQKVFAVRAKLTELPLRAGLLVGKSETEIEAVLTDWMKEVCDFFASGADDQQKGGEA